MLGPPSASSLSFSFARCISPAFACARDYRFSNERPIRLRRQRRYTAAESADRRHHAFMWQHWVSQPQSDRVLEPLPPGVACDLAMPFVSGAMVDALTRGPKASARRVAPMRRSPRWRSAFTFPATRRCASRFRSPPTTWSASSLTGSATCSGSPPTGTPTISPARPCGGFRGR